LNLGANILLYLLKFLIVIKRLFTAFFIYCIYKPLRVVLRFIFYKFIVKFYKYYLVLLRKIGWTKKEEKLLSYIFNQKLIHIIVIIITIVFVMKNLTAKTEAVGLSDQANNTILSDLIQSEFGQYEEDQQLIVETFDKEETITQAQQKYLDNLTTINAQSRVSMDSKYDDEEISATINGGNIIKSDAAVTNMTKRQRDEIIKYVVKPGDTISTIAEDFEISVSTILWENNLNAYSIIRPGNELSILPANGISYNVVKNETIGSIAKKYSIDEEELLKVNKLSADDKLAVGEKLIIPGGKKIAYVEPAKTNYNGITALKNIVKAPSAQPVAGNKMNWPTEGMRITQYYSWSHHAVDIANKVGTPIYACDSGTIEYAGWGTGYGNQIVIDHGGGKKTRYGHLSKFYVEKGEKVTKGQTIAAMGSTGWSTGPHVHFEVIINGTKYNPLNYIK
jgi:murein DD-endopeptidase MepM/ murein hydrolase activator NlpD